MDNTESVCYLPSLFGRFANPFHANAIYPHHGLPIKLSPNRIIRNIRPGEDLFPFKVERPFPVSTKLCEINLRLESQNCKSFPNDRQPKYGTKRDNKLSPVALQRGGGRGLTRPHGGAHVIRIPMGYTIRGEV